MLVIRRKGLFDSTTWLKYNVLRLKYITQQLERHSVLGSAGYTVFQYYGGAVRTRRDPPLRALHHARI